jgi:nitrile hydratase accessory protein
MRVTPDQHIAQMHEHLALPRQNGELLFAAPWEARAFGLAVALNESGVYAWREFSQSLAAETTSAEQNGVPSSYYERWLEALEHLVITKGVVTHQELDLRTREYASGVHDGHAQADHTHHWEDRQ